MRNAEQAAKAFRFCVPSLVDMVLSSSLPEPSVERGRQSSCFASSMAAPALCRPFDAWDARRSADTHRMRGCLRHSHPNAALFQVLLCLPTAPGLPLQGNGDFGTSAFFGQLSDKPLLACIWSHGVRGAKRNAWSKIKRWAPSWRIAVVSSSIGLAVGRRKRFEFNR